MHAAKQAPLLHGFVSSTVSINEKRVDVLLELAEFSSLQQWLHRGLALLFWLWSPKRDSTELSSGPPTRCSGDFFNAYIRLYIRFLLRSSRFFLRPPRFFLRPPC